jgi:hypothetical protein
MKRSNSVHGKRRAPAAPLKTSGRAMRVQSMMISFLIHGLLAFGLIRGVQGMVNGWPGNTTLIQSPDRSPAR